MRGGWWRKGGKGGKGGKRFLTPCLSLCGERGEAVDGMRMGC